MSRVTGVQNDPNTLLFYCPGCECPHEVTVNGKRNSMGATWEWNGSHETPTLSPSLLLTGQCHSFVKNGQIQFLADSKHKLAGQTVEIPDWDSIP